MSRGKRIKEVLQGFKMLLGKLRAVFGMVAGRLVKSFRFVGRLEKPFALLKRYHPVDASM